MGLHPPDGSRLLTWLRVCLFVSYGSKCREKAVKWRAFQDYFAFYSEPVAQTSKLIVYCPPEDANPSVDDGLCSDTVTARAKSGAPFCSLLSLQLCLLSPSCVVPSIEYSSREKEQCLASSLMAFTAL